MDKSRPPGAKKAAAIRYNPSQDQAPEVSAIGQGLIAEKIIQLAQEAGLPIREDPILVEALHGIQIGEDVPPELYLAVAEVLVWAWGLDQDRKDD